MPAEDVTDQLPQEPPQPVEPQPAPAEPAGEVPTVDTLTLRIRDQDHQLRSEALQAVAEDLGLDNPAAVLNLLRGGAEAAEVYREAREMYRRANRTPQPQTPPVEERWQQHVKREQPQQYQRGPETTGDDPLELIRAMNSKLQEVAQRQEQVAEYMERQTQQALFERQQREQEFYREANSEYKKFADELRKVHTPEHRIPDMNYLLEEAEQMGMFGGRLPVGELYRRTYRMLYGEDIAQDAAANALQQARSPKARVTVSTGKQVTPPQPPAPNSIAGMEAQLGTTKWGDVAQFIPERR